MRGRASPQSPFENKHSFRSLTESGRGSYVLPLQKRGLREKCDTTKRKKNDELISKACWENTWL